MKLGEALVHANHITPQQLQGALEAQMVYGGHLGTCLIELGCIDERTLGEALAESTGLRFAGAELFQDIPRYVIESIPARLADKYSVVPFRRQERVLDVAMVDPKDLRVLDELSFASGCRIEAWIAPEVRIFQALERYYDIPRRQRYVALCRRIEYRDADVVHSYMAQQSVAEGSGTTAWRAVSSTAVLDPPAASIAEAPHAGAPHSVAERSLGPLLVQDASLEEVVEAMCRVRTENQAATLAFDFLGPRLERLILFRVRSSMAEVWTARGFAQAQEENVLSITSEPLFQLLLGNSHFRGAPPAEERCRAFFDRLHAAPPKELLLVPIHVEDRLVAILYADNGAETRIPGNTETYCMFAEKVGLAIHLARIKQRLRAL